MMTKIKGKQILLYALGSIAVLAAVYFLLRFGFSMDVLDRSGWDNKNGAYRYLDYYGRPQTQWQQIDGKRYYFAPEDGTMVTGWYTINGAQYYFYENGQCAAGWHQTDGAYYYFDENGAMVTGWRQIDGEPRYFAQDGTMTVGWLQLDGNRMYFSEAGVPQTGWLTLEGNRYYLDHEGFAVSGWVEMDDVRCQFREDGSVVTGWFEDPSGRYFFGEDGRPCSGWLDWEQKRYYLNSDGSVTTGWLTMEQERYYFHPNGRMAIGEVEIDGVSRFFTSTGKEVLLTNPWHPVPGDYEVDLVYIEGYQIDRSTKDPLQQMMNDCRAAGHYCVINNSYRSRATQQTMWDNRIAGRMAAGMSKAQAEEVTGRALAIPGRSEHQTGLAVDIVGSQKMYDWLAEHCWDYGFILRYPDDRIDITGIIFEPWHFRYVGTELSKELESLGLCMEEYMAMLTEQQKNIAD